jgi:hypothetical protein
MSSGSYSYLHKTFNVTVQVAVKSGALVSYSTPDCGGGITQLGGLPKAMLHVYTAPLLSLLAVRVRLNVAVVVLVLLSGRTMLPSDKNHVALGAQWP